MERSLPEPPGSGAAPQTAGDAKRSDRWLLLILLVLALLLGRGITRGEIYFFNDETRHVMNGVFVRDLLADRAFSDPIQYAFQYYAKYPATALPHWPPLFPLLEGLLFGLVGIHVWAARLLVLGFALMAAYYWYRIAEREGPRHLALLSTLIFPLLPLLQLYSSVVMLEIPLLGLSLGAIYYWRRFQEEMRSRHLWLLALFTVASFLTSQKAIFLFFFVVISLLLRGPYRLLLRWDVWAALVASLSVVVPWYLFSFRVLSVGADRVIGLGVSQFAAHLWWQLSFYPELVPRQLGWPLAILAAAGLGWALLCAPRRHGFLLIWIASCYLCFTLIWEKDIRHSMAWIPPLVYFALAAVDILFARRRWSLLAAGALAVVTAVGSLQFERPYMEGVAEAARFILSKPETDVIYYQGALNGSFIYSVRQLDPEKRRVVARSKLVLATRIQYAKQAIVTTPEGVIDMFRRWGIRYLAVENRETISELAVVNRALATGPFELAGIFPIRTTDPGLTGRKILVYRFTGELITDSEPVAIPMMTLRNGAIRVNLKNLAGQPWPR